MSRATPDLELVAVSKRFGEVLALHVRPGTVHALLGENRTLVGAVLFGAATALQFTAQALNWQLPYQIFLAAPYVITLAVLVASVRGGAPPAALGQRYVTDGSRPDE